jgi:hypothetical protein
MTMHPTSKGPDWWGGGLDLVRPLQLPDGFRAPRGLAFAELRAFAIGRQDLDDDVAGINANVELIATTRGGGWPAAPVTAEENYVDLVWHELEFRENYSFTYVLRRPDGAYIGCAYLYPVGRRVRLHEHADSDVDVSWWVTRPAYDDGLYTMAYQALRHWIATEFPFHEPVYSNSEIPA